MKKHYFLFFAIIIGSFSFGQTLLSEDFNYGSTAGNLLAASSGVWASHSGTANQVGYLTTSLSMTNYPSSGVGGSAAVIGSLTEDVNRTFTLQSSGIVYLSALVSISSVSTAGNYFLHLADGAVSNFRARIGAKDDGTGKILFGITTSGSSPIYGTTKFDLNTTYLLVASYDVTNGVSKLYVLNSHSTTEPTTPEISDTAASTSAIGSIALRQSTNIPTATIDGVRVGTTWNNTVVTTVLSTKANEIQGFEMYPNPSSLGYVNILSKSKSEMNVKLYNLLGKLVIDSPVINNKLDVSNLTNGVYVMKVSQDGFVSNQKLVIK